MADLSSLLLNQTQLSRAYRSGLSPGALVREVKHRIERDRDNPVWISVLGDDELAPYVARLASSSPEALPLYGLPFAIKDNIDLAGVPTTAACEAFAYTPGRSAPVVERLIELGAVPIGKTNLDQFATGLVGTRSPWGAVRCAFDDTMISGGSSAGSAVAVARGHVTFSLGTDTAGSGRVPAAFNNLVGLKPSRGLLSTRGVVPACRTLDCVSIFALDVHDAAQVFREVAVYDSDDPFARRSGIVSSAKPGVVGVPDPATLDFEGDEDYRAAFEQAIAACPFETKRIDVGSLLEAAELLYGGAWVAERYHAARDLIEGSPELLREEFLAIAKPAASLTAVDYFDGAYRLAAIRRQAEALFSEVDAIVMPTAPTHFSLAEIEAEPLTRNAVLGRFTNFMNLLDLAGIAIPAGTTRSGLPFGVTLISDTFGDEMLLRAAREWLAQAPRPLGASGETMTETEIVPAVTQTMPIAVCGAHLTGMPLNKQLVERGATLREATSSAPGYRLYALPGGPPHRPGMVRDEANGAAIEVEVFDVPLVHVGSFLAGIPAPLGLGKVELASGEWVTGFICEPCGLEGAEEITHLGGWRAYTESLG